MWIVEVDLVVNDLDWPSRSFLTYSLTLEPSISQLLPLNSIMKDEFVDPSSSLHSFSFDLSNFTNRDPFTSKFFSVDFMITLSTKPLLIRDLFLGMKNWRYQMTDLPQ